MDQNTSTQLDALAALLWGQDAAAFNCIDAVLVAMILEHAQVHDGLDLPSRVAIKAIVELSTVNGDLARRLMVELANNHI